MTRSKKQSSDHNPSRMSARAAIANHLKIVCTVTTLLAVATGCTHDGKPLLPGFNAQAGSPANAEPPRPKNVWPVQGVWVVRQAWSSPDQIATVMDQCYQLGLNSVFFQVRGEGTAYYRSSIEPWAREFDWRDPGFDPLEVACREAHRRGLALHAWVNVMPAWRGDTPPDHPQQLYNARPDWFLYDQNGKRQPLGWYSSVNPCLPEVREYLTSVCREIVTRYPVDGLHLDYIRFPVDESPRGSDYPHDRKTLALYHQATGKRPGDSKQAWSAWRADQVTRLVSQISHMVRRQGDDVKLTTACTPDMNTARNRYFQDAPRWAREDLIDAAIIMNYAADTDFYRRRQETWRRTIGATAAAGIGVYMHKSPQATREQIALAQSWGTGYVLFSDKVLFTRTEKANAYASAVRDQIGKTVAHQRPKPLAASQSPASENQAGNSEGPRNSSTVNHPYGIVP